MGTIDRIRYSELVDTPKLQELLKSLNQVTGVANAVIDVEGSIIAHSGWQEACTGFHRVNPETCRRCEDAPACDNELSRAVLKIPGLEVGPEKRRSTKHLNGYCALLDRFVQLHGEDMMRLREHLAKGESDAAHVVAHNLKGIAGLIGARNVASLASEIARELRQDANSASIIALASACENDLASMTKAVRALPLPPRESAAQ